MTVYANIKGSAAIKFRYIYGHEERSSVNIECGIFDVNQSRIIPLVTKVGFEEATRLENVTGDNLGEKATLYTNWRTPNTIGIILRDIDKSFPNQFQCRGAFVNYENDLAEQVFSEKVQLTILGKFFSFTFNKNLSTFRKKYTFSQLHMRRVL